MPTRRQFALMAALAPLAGAQSGSGRRDTPEPNLRIDTTLVLIPLTVLDPLNRPVGGLEKENFRIFDEGAEQTIVSFAQDDEDVAVALVFDTSGSMGRTLERSRMAAAEFFKTSNPHDEFCLIEFDNNPRLVVPLTEDTTKISGELLFSKSSGSTALLDAIYLALHEMKKSTKRKKALLIISDGGDNHSRYTETEVRDVIRESDVMIYAIGVFGGGQGFIEEINGPRLLRRIATETGGRLLEGSYGDLPDAARKISLDLRSRYVLGFSPTDKTRDGRFHHVKVTIVVPKGLPKKLTVQWRQGYYARTE